MDERIAGARVELEINDDAVVAGLQRVEREFQRTVKDIDRTRATATADLKIAPFEDAVANIKREMKELEGKKATASLDMDDKEYQKKMKALRKELKDVEGQKATVELDVKGEQKVLAAREKLRKAAEAETRAIEQREDKRAKVEQQAEARRLAMVRNGARVSASLNRQREKELASAHSWALKLNSEMDRSEQTRQRELQSIPRLQREYVELAQKLELLANARRKAARDDTAKLTIDFKIAEAEAKMRTLHEDLERIGSPISLSVNIRPGQNFGRNMREAFQVGGVTSAAFVFGAGLGDRMVRGVRSTFSPKAIGNAASDVLARIGHAFSNLSEATVRLGPFTATVRQAILALSILGPTILDLVGAVGALVGVVGTGLTGAMALAAGGISAFGVSLGGIGFLLPSLLSDFKNLTTLQNAYHVQVLKTGENSEKAKKKLKEFNHALGVVPDTTRKAFLSLDKLKDSWGDLAKAARPDFFEAMGEAIRTASHQMGWFAENTRRAFHQASEGWQDWMRGLRGGEADRILHNLGSRGNESIQPLMRSLGNIATIFGRIAESSSRFLPQMMRDFEKWTERVKNSATFTDNLDSNIDRLVEHTKSLGGFLAAAGGFLVSFFDSGADSGKNLLDVMADTLRSWTDFNRSVEGRAKLKEFFDRSVEGAKALVAALAPVIASFVTWAAEMSPVVTQFLKGAGYVASFVAEILKLTGLQDSVSAVATTLGALWAVTRIRAATTALTGFSKALVGARTAGAATAAAGPGVGAVPAGAAAAGGAVAGRSMGTAMKSTAMAGLKSAGWVGVAIAAMTFVGDAMQTAAKREGFTSTIRGIGQDLAHVMTLGFAQSADEASADIGKHIQDAVNKNVSLAEKGGLRLGDRLKAAFGPKGRLLGLIDAGDSKLDLTVDQKKLIASLQQSKAIANRLARDFHLPKAVLTVTTKSNPADLKTIENNFNRLKNNLAGTNAGIRKNTNETMAAIKNSMGTNSEQGKAAVEKSMGLTVGTIRRNMKAGVTSTSDGMQEIRRQFRVHSQASKRTAEVNFGAAKSAIQMAVKDGQISSEKGLREIHKLWVDYLKLYGFTEKQARNEVKPGTRFDAGPDEGSRTVRAGGGVVNIGRKGVAARDNVPAMLNGQPSVVARGEQVAVFNRHQQKAMDRQLPGGLEGFFASNQRKHYMAGGGIVGSPYAGGGIVPVPGFPGERAASSILDEIAWVARTFGLILTDAYGQGHQSPGHTVTGTAADFSGSDRSMDAAVKALVARGYLVGYDGRFGSQDWPGHGPSTRTPNFHLHVEFGGKNGDFSGATSAMAADKIERQKAAPGLGAVTAVVQGGLDIALGAAQASLDAAAAQSLSVPTGGGGSGVAGNNAQVRAWLAAGLRLAGQDPSAANINTLYGRVMQESGGNPRAQNNWDSNAAAGHPSKGLLQTIDSTFNTYKVPGHNNIWNPVDNVAAAVRYMLATYGHLVAASGSGYAAGGIATMSEAEWARGGMVERPTLMTGEDGRRAPEFVIGTNPAYRANNIEALTAAANKLGVPMARKSKTGTVNPSLKVGEGKDPEKLKEVKRYADIQKQEENKRREINIAESRVKEPDTLIKQQGTDAIGNPLYVVDQAKIDAYVAMMTNVKNLYDELLFKIMENLRKAAEAAYGALEKYRTARTTNIHNLDAQNAINLKLRKSKDPDVREAADRRYQAGLQMREDQINLRTQASDVKTRIKEDQADAVYRVQEYGITRQDLISDILSVGNKASADAASETASAYNEPPGPGDAPPTPGQAAATRLETELALAKAGYGMNGRLGGARDVSAIINDLIAANQTQITEAQALLSDTDPANDQTAYEAITSAAQAIQGLRDDLNQSQGSMTAQTTALSGAMRDLYSSFGGNFSLAQSGLAAGGTVASAMRSPYQVGSGIQAGAFGAASGAVVNIEQNFPTQPDPMTWAAATKYELAAAL